MRPPKKNSGGQRGGNPPKATQRDLDSGDASPSFQSPDDENATDYGLEFTTSRLNLQNSNSPRTSTVRKDVSAARRRQNEETSGEENRPPEPADRRAGQRQESSSQEDNQALELNTSNRSLRSLNAPQPQRPRANPQTQQAPRAVALRRKQTRPISRVALMQQEIQRLQATPKLLIPRLPFSRLVREIIVNLTGLSSAFRVTQGAMEALQTAAEMYTTQRLQDAYLLTLHRGRVTLEVRDMALMAFLCSHCRYN
ncbi:histone H3-like centromeric protein cid [Drosophila miranda]|uniref:histone H3-like centromeric protein cid n=1 Tax=Drosophila miranda TaxID=7229 RepID=UPI0007E5F70E|nr:histone H3-like centromeric protein cid [Drosophila miranda]XP_033247332.1 histone H3-like centromeric protein cid [Drosophila miranda]XP_033247337.1 histone H3-like centromeric protein cid [Drosophila miranda]